MRGHAIRGFPLPRCLGCNFTMDRI
eukprot:g28250.t1